MRRIYTKAHETFLRKYVPGHSIKEILKRFNARFHMDLTEIRIKSLMHRLGLRCGVKPNPPRIYTKEVCSFIKKNNKGKTALQMSELLTKKFKKEFTVTQVKIIRQKLHLISGLTGRFEKGNIPPNKGKKGYCAKGCEVGWFKKGNNPRNKLPVGTEIIDAKGYKKIKIADPNKWEFLHKIIWQKHNGKIPAGHCVSFKDGNKLNCTIGNLFIISRAENAVLNHEHLRSFDPDITQTALTLAKIKLKARNLKKNGNIF